MATKVEAIHQFPTPTSLKLLQQFARMINFHHRFIPASARIMAPIYQALKGKPSKFQWTEELHLAFTNAKQALVHSTLLHRPQKHAPLALTVDASSIAVGGVLEQLIDNVWQPLAFFSRQLRKPETKYSAFDRELLALYLAVRHFCLQQGFRSMVQSTATPSRCNLRVYYRRSSHRWETKCSCRRIISSNSWISGNQYPARGRLRRISQRSTVPGDQRLPHFHHRTLVRRDTFWSYKCSSYLRRLYWHTPTGRSIILAKKLFDVIHGLSHPSIRATQ